MILDILLMAYAAVALVFFLSDMLSYPHGWMPEGKSPIVAFIDAMAWLPILLLMIAFALLQRRALQKQSPMERRRAGQ